MSPDDRDGSGEVPQDEREDRPELDVDTAFAAIVAGWGEPAPVGSGSWPDAEDMPDREGRTPADGAGQPGDGPLPEPPASGPLIPMIGPAPEPEPVPEDERFVPPEPPPLPRGDPATRLAWAGVAGGPVFLLIAALFWRELPQMLLMLAVVCFIAGFVTLVVRMPRDRSPGDDDDGAVVSGVSRASDGGHR